MTQITSWKHTFRSMTHCSFYHQLNFAWWGFHYDRHSFSITAIKKYIHTHTQIHTENYTYPLSIVAKIFKFIPCKFNHIQYFKFLFFAHLQYYIFLLLTLMVVSTESHFTGLPLSWKIKTQRFFSDSVIINHMAYPWSGTECLHCYNGSLMQICALLAAVLTNSLPLSCLPIPCSRWYIQHLYISYLHKTEAIPQPFL